MMEALKRIVAWPDPHMDGASGKWSIDIERLHSKPLCQQFISLTEHDRIVAEKDAENHVLHQEITRLQVKAHGAVDAARDMELQIARLTAERDGIKQLWETRGKYHALNGCACRFDDDGETLVSTCAAHIAILARLTAERDAIAALTVERCAEVFASHNLIRMQDWSGMNSWRHIVYKAIRSLSPIPPHVAAARVLLANPDAALRLAQEYDREDAAMRGEPDPHDVDFDTVEDAEWLRDRIACAEVALRALADQVEKGRSDSVV